MFDALTPSGFGRANQRDWERPAAVPAPPEQSQDAWGRVDNSALSVRLELIEERLARLEQEVFQAAGVGPNQDNMVANCLDMNRAYQMIVGKGTY